MTFSEVCRIYEREDKYLILNPTVPSWIVTNINGVLLLKLYQEGNIFDEIACEFSSLAPNVSRESVIEFLRNAEEECLFNVEDILLCSA